MCEENDLNRRFKFDFDAPQVSAVDVEKLKAFLMKDEEPTLIFYGGEPLLQMDKIKELIDGLQNVPNIKFRMQTNGKLLDKFDIGYLKKIGKILVSIDGTKERTDFNKGEGTYDKVVGNLQAIRAAGYDGEIVARMAVSGFSDVYEQVMHLAGLTTCADNSRLLPHRPAPRPPAPESAHADSDICKLSYLPCQAGGRSAPGKLLGNSRGVFDSIHWQLDVGFYSCDYELEGIRKFVEGYNKGISKLVDWWVSEIKLGKVWKLYPFLGIFENLYYGRETKLMCGAGHSGYTITTDGNLVACPIMGCMPDFYCGTLDSAPSELREIGPASRCEECAYLKDCGGRCLYVNSVNLWPPEGLDMVCSSVKYLIDLLKGKLEEIRGLIAKCVVSEKDFEYEKYFGPEIVP